METYRKYFNIDPDFFPAVDSDVIRKDPELWKKFYPHDTFISLIKKVINVLERREKLNIWVEGAYGTGKSHAVFTLKHLLDASTEETKEYFKEFNLDTDLCNQFITAKSQGKIITVHRYGSSSIHNENELFMLIQESIENALKEAHIDNIGQASLKESVIDYFSDEENKRSFEVYVKGSYKEWFGNESIDDIIDHLKVYKDQALISLMDKLFKVANDKNIKTLTLTDLRIRDWITDIIQSNKLKAIVFIWDEFSEYFNNNKHQLSGFQHLLQLSQTQPFCFIPVTHRSDAILDDTDDNKKKIIDRFCKPRCVIELPENMAFQLMGAAMRKNNDPVISNEWNTYLSDLVNRSHDARIRIQKYAKIDDQQLQGILPIHPYAACLLKHISSSFASNQRSMFDFIKNGGNTDQKGFQWFIDNYGPLDENPFLTIDQLWGFFYDTGKNDLSQSIRQILDRYASLSANLDADEQKVLKTILLFQAISRKAGDTVDILLPNETNLSCAFEGTNLDTGQAVSCADKLVRDKVIYKKSIKDGSFVYSVLTGDYDTDQIEKYKKEFIGEPTSKLINDDEIKDNIIDLNYDLKMRFKIEYSAVTDFDAKAKAAISKANEDLLHFYIIFALSKDSDEGTLLTKKIETTLINNPETSVIFINCKDTPLGKSEFDKWVENKAKSKYYLDKDRESSSQYSRYAKNILTTWRTNIQNGPFAMYAIRGRNNEKIPGLEALNEYLRNIDKKRFPLALECNYNSSNNWWLTNSIAVGVECGVLQIEKGVFNYNNAKLSKQLANAWRQEEYWEKNPSDVISRLKVLLKQHIDERLKERGRISIREIYDFVNQEPYGFLPCNMTAFFLGFLLKEYVNDKYTYSDDITSDSLTVDKLKDMIKDVIMIDKNDQHYRPTYIVMMTPEEKRFIESTADAFRIPPTQCSSIERSRDSIRNQMKNNLPFPIWTLIGILDQVSLQSSTTIITLLINDYLELTNNNGERTDTDIANEIGAIHIANEKAVNDLKELFTTERCKQGMLNYLQNYRSGELIDLATRVNDGGQYINELQRKLGSGDGNWVWKQHTLDAQIDDLILEYKIILETSKILGPCSKYSEAITTWIEKTDNIKVSFEVIKDIEIDLKPLLSLLKDIKIKGLLEGKDKEKFLQLLLELGPLFTSFYTTRQKDDFKKACSFELQDLNDGDRDRVYTQMPSGCYTMDKVTYKQLVEQSVTTYKNDLNSIKIKKIWKERTNTDSPRDWCKKYQMPILLMLSDQEYTDYKNTFDTINDKNPSDQSIEKALVYLEKYKHWDDLNSADMRDKVFKQKMLEDCSVILTNIQEVKDYIQSHVSLEPQDWAGNNTVKEKIKELAESKYNEDGYENAIKRIDTMDPEEVKKYLKDLIKNNMQVGIQIIKND